MSRTLGAKNLPPREKTASHHPTKKIHAGRWPKQTATVKKNLTVRVCPQCGGHLETIDMYGKPLYRCPDWRCPKYKQPAFQKTAARGSGNAV